MNEDKKKFTFEEKVVADRVADEILTVDDDKENKKYFFLVLLFLVCLIFLVSSLSFAIFDTYYNGGNNNVIDVGVDVIIDDNDDDNDKDNVDNTDKDSNDNVGNKDSSKKSDSTTDDIDNNSNRDSNSNSNNNISIQPSRPASVLFSFNEGSNYINMVDVYPMSDQLGKKLTGSNQYFDFNVSAVLTNNKSGKLVYEISLVPLSGNTIDEDDVRVYLMENGSAVSLSDNAVNNYGDLPTSKYHSEGKVIYRKVVSDKFYGNYIFRMWLSSDAKVAQVSKKFGCKIAVDAYYK
ncbi:MAG: hypothetical protein ACI31R_03780 [Bacilli bacterium]